MTHPGPQVKLEGEVQTRLVDAWELLSEAVELALSREFGRSFERQEWVRKLQALRGCVLLAAARLIDVHHIEALPVRDTGRRSCRRSYTGHAFAKRRPRTNGESSVVHLADEVGAAARKFELMCPLGFPAMEYGLGRLADWIRSGEVELVRFFAVESTPGRECAKRRKAKVELRKAVLDALAEQDRLLKVAAERMARRAAGE